MYRIYLQTSKSNVMYRIYIYTHRPANPIYMIYIRYSNALVMLKTGICHRPFLEDN